MNDKLVARDMFVSELLAGVDLCDESLRSATTTEYGVAVLEHTRGLLSSLRLVVGTYMHSRPGVSITAEMRSMEESMMRAEVLARRGELTGEDLLREVSAVWDYAGTYLSDYIGAVTSSLELSHSSRGKRADDSDAVLDTILRTSKSAGTA